MYTVKTSWVLTSLEVSVVCLHSSIPALRLSGMLPNSRGVSGALNKYNDDDDGIHHHLQRNQGPQNDPVGQSGPQESNDKHNEGDPAHGSTCECKGLRQVVVHDDLGHICGVGLGHAPAKSMLDAECDIDGPNGR